MSRVTIERLTLRMPAAILTLLRFRTKRGSVFSIASEFKLKFLILATAAE